MQTLTPQKKRQLEKLAKVIDQGDFAILEHLLEVETKIDERYAEIKQEFSDWKDEIKSSIPSYDEILKSVRGKDAHTPTDEELIALIKPLIPEAKDGKTPTDQELLALIRPLIPQVKDGKTPTRSELLSLIEPLIPSIFDLTKEAIGKLTPLIPKIEDIEKDIPKLGAPIRDALELLQGDERLDRKAVKGLDEWLKENEQKFPFTDGIVGRDIVKDYDISAQLNGVTKTFNLPAVWNVISVDLSSSPFGSLRKNVDFTWTPTSITFTSQIDASTQLASGQSCVLTIVTG